MTPIEAAKKVLKAADEKCQYTSSPHLKDQAEVMYAMAAIDHAETLARAVMRYQRILEEIVVVRNLVRRDEAGFGESLSMGEGAIAASRECLDVSRAMLDTVLDSIESDMKGERSGDMDT